MADKNITLTGDETERIVGLLTAGSYALHRINLVEAHYECSDAIKLLSRKHKDAEGEGE